MGSGGRGAVADTVCNLIKLLLNNKMTQDELASELNLNKRVVGRYIQVLSCHFLVHEEIEPGNGRNIGHINRYWISKGNGKLSKVI